MNKDTVKLYTVTTVITVLSLLALFLPVENTALVCLALTLPSAVAVFFIIKKRTALSIHKREVLILMAVIGALYVMLLYLSGMHFGYSYTVVYQKGIQLFSKVIPTVLIILSVEIIRCILLEQKKRFVSFMAYAFCIICEIAMHYNIYSIESFNSFMDVMGLTLVPAFTAQLAYNHLSREFGFVPIFVYRSITTIYPFIFSVVPAAPDALVAVSETLLPILIVVFLKAMYSRRIPEKRKKAKIISRIISIVTTIIMVSAVMIISCQFSIRAVVIATESMTGEINKGDAVVYEVIGDQYVGEGDVVVFQKYNSRIVHRIVETKQINGETQYYTKGDANNFRDAGYITREDIEGIVNFKIPYIGYPTLWLNDLFE